MLASSSNSLLEALSTIIGTGNFCSVGAAPFFFPGLQIEGLGELAFPLPASQARELVALSEIAPFGQGENTVHDEKVRKCWQLDAARFSFKSPRWMEFIDEVVARLREDLGISGKVSASPYKLLLYGEGGHFKAHRDTEKLDAMFGTLIIALPSAHEGGRLFIRHGGREIEVDFSRQEHLHEFQHVALFADCEHEVEPVRSGYRCCLVYNLHLDKGDPGKLNLSLTHQAKSLLAPLGGLKRECAAELSAVLLEHSYTEANLSLQHLKGNDHARAHALFAAAKKSGYTVHLALVTYHKMGELDEGGGYDYYGDDEAENDGEESMGEIYEQSISIGHWRDACDRAVELGRYVIESDALITKENFGEGDPDEKESEGYTGNAGCTMDYWYRRAAVILWPKEDHEEILCQYDFRGACRELDGLANNGKPGPAFQRLAKAVVSRLHHMLPSREHMIRARDSDSSPFALVLAALAKSGSRDLLDDLITEVPAQAFLLCDAALWTKLHQAFGTDVFDPVRATLMEEGVPQYRRSLFQILDSLSSKKKSASKASIIASRLASLTPKESRPDHWSRSRDPQAPGDHEETRILLAASHLLEAADDRSAALDFLLADQSLDYVRQILAPALLDKRLAKYFAETGSLAPELLAFAKGKLGEEVAVPVMPYSDWIRPCPSLEGSEKGTPYTRGSSPFNAALQELSVFMADPAVETHPFRHIQAVRTSLKSYIQNHFLDLDHVTLKKGSPHSLVCTKNDKSYHHALSCRAKDEKLLEKIACL